MEVPGSTPCVALDQAPNGSRAEVVRLPGGQAVSRKLTELGILPGSILDVQRSAPLGGPMLIHVRGATVALGRRVAQRVTVRILP